MVFTLDYKRDVIEKPLNGKIDISGWDIKKAFRLFKKSNPPLLEWLNSPIVYQEKFSITERLRNLLPGYYSPVSCRYHYLHMAQGNLREYLKGDTVWVKKYFYVLRPVLACRWIEAGMGVVPMELEKLIEMTVKSDILRSEIEKLLERKKSGHELDWGPKIPVLSEFVLKEIERLSKEDFEKNKVQPDNTKLDDLFRSSLDEAWESKLTQ